MNLFGVVKSWKKSGFAIRTVFVDSHWEYYFGVNVNYYSIEHLSLINVFVC